MEHERAKGREGGREVKSVVQGGEGGGLKQIEGVIVVKGRKGEW